MASKENETAKPLMPKATAVWLIENTGLTFRQIGAFCVFTNWKFRVSQTTK